MKARVAISRETVNPTPARVRLPRTAPHPTEGRSRPRLTRSTAQDPARTPSGLASVQLSTMPRVTGEVTLLCRRPESIRIPALARAKSGAIR
ncbi:hypothetical protein ADL25_30135 [Streptomyces sp. NRRL F-5122]|nr:hypothetical protein ADL25_30135 [Streptomyces sp. NRRL F-5122]